mmetsp:Transcript_21384/g.58425  ORF Transcript_21384/g.58425 Transcript_21384/m.58425 type:complete len:265 (-) Transcript_21384:1433-2227(-)
MGVLSKIKDSQLARAASAPEGSGVKREDPARVRCQEVAVEDPVGPQDLLADPLVGQDADNVLAILRVVEDACKNNKHLRAVRYLATGEHQVTLLQRDDGHCRVAQLLHRAQVCRLQPVEERVAEEGRAEDLVVDLGAKRLGDDAQELDVGLLHPLLLFCDGVLGVQVHAASQASRDPVLLHELVENRKGHGVLAGDDRKAGHAGGDIGHKPRGDEEAKQEGPDGEAPFEGGAGLQVDGAGKVCQRPMQRQDVLLEVLVLGHAAD